MQSILVTGANKGIGLAVVKAILLEQPEYQVLLGSRDHQRGEAAATDVLSSTGVDASRLEVLPLDVSNRDSVIEAASRVKKSANNLVGLVNNAGIASGSLSRILDVNARGMQAINEHFLPFLPDEGRVVNVASASGPNYVARCSAKWQQFLQDKQLEWSQLNQFMHDCAQMTPREMEEKGLSIDGHYGLSKACANLLSLISARENSRLTINACTPGYIFTDLTQDMTGASAANAAEFGMKQPDDGARVIMQLLFDPLESSGWYFGSDGLRSPLDRYRSPGSAAYSGE